jgi:hypothetical protein
MLAERLAAEQPDDVELVFVCTGAEEASTGGALALARAKSRGEWSPADTLVVGIDGMTNGATDVVPFLAHGYDGICLACIDHHIGAPRHYHWPTDTAENLDADQFDRSVAFAEAYVRELMGAS